MKIIKKGKLPEKEIIKTCYFCKTEFSYTVKDIQIDMRDGNYVKCPVCKLLINTQY